MEYYSAEKWNKLLILLAIWINLRLGWMGAARFSILRKKVNIFSIYVKICKCNLIYRSVVSYARVVVEVRGRGDGWITKRSITRNLEGNGCLHYFHYNDVHPCTRPYGDIYFHLLSNYIEVKWLDCMADIHLTC